MSWFSILVYYRPGKSCDCLKMYDGCSDAILNMGSYLVSHDILRSYMHSFLHGRYYKAIPKVFFLYILCARVWNKVLVVIFGVPPTIVLL